MMRKECSRLPWFCLQFRHSNVNRNEWVSLCMYKLDEEREGGWGGGGEEEEL